MRLHHTIFVNLFIILKSKLRFTVPNKIPSPPHCQNLMPSVRHAQTWTVREREPQTSSVSFQQTSFELQLLVPLLIPTPALPNGCDVLQHLLRLPLRLLESQICRVTKKVFPFGFFCQKKSQAVMQRVAQVFIFLESLPSLLSQIERRTRLQNFVSFARTVHSCCDSKHLTHLYTKEV